MFQNSNYAFAGAFVDELHRCGLKHICFCPGSRSSPLAVSFAKHPSIKLWPHLDERSAAFFALGMACSLREPVAVLCSSGTAAANFSPAVAEAWLSGVPLLVLTADRPTELHGWGALQTIDQTRMYRSQIKWSLDMPTPEAVSLDLMGSFRSVACRAYVTASSSYPGPVHVNFPFRDPLEPLEVPEDFPSTLDTRDQRFLGRPDGKPFVSAPTLEQQLRPEDIEGIGRQLAGAERGIIVCGPQLNPELAQPVAALASRLAYPILADALSQVRCGSHDRGLVVDSYDAFIRDAQVADSLAPDVVIRFGALPVSKPLTQYLERHRNARHILVNDSVAWADPFRLTSEIVRGDPALFCSQLASILDTPRHGREWATRWLETARKSRAAISRVAGRFEGMFEGRLFTQLAELLPNDAIMFAGNSMPVRDMDTFVPSSERTVRFMSNRGASGIDGVVSTALGVSAATEQRVVLVVGDISFYHDMNGLLAAKAHSPNATIIVVNNNGGGVFSFLPQADYDDVFETCFGTPHGLTYERAAQLYGLEYSRPEGWEQFKDAVKGSLRGTCTDIIEVFTAERDRNVVSHREVWKSVSDSVKAMAR